MAGSWTITRTATGGSLLTYRDFRGGSWVCGEAPADVPERAVLEWVVGECRYGDAIIEHGTVFVVAQPVIGIM